MTKRLGRHPEKALTAVQVRALKVPGRYADGNGLYLVVDPSGAKRWLLRTVVKERRRDIGLGGLTLVSLAEAREKALSYRKLAREGGDPLAERRVAKVAVPTFAEAVERVHAENAGTWRNAKHAAQWRNTLQQYVCPDLGERTVDRIETPDILRVLTPIWLEKPETARRVRQRIGTVLDWAKASGFRQGENPVAGVTKGLSRQTTMVKHHEALPWAEVPVFIARLRQTRGEMVRLAFEFLILTAGRTEEIMGARWPEFALDQGLWTVPAERMKGKREHRVPLSTPVLAILERAREFGDGSDLVFPGRRTGKPLSEMAFLMLLRRMKVPVTAHGFRSSFRDWAAETTAFPNEVVEMAIAHKIKGKVEAAYRRGDLLDKRRPLMQEWAAFVTTQSTGDQRHG